MSVLNIQDIGARVTILGDYNDAEYPYYNPSIAFDGDGKLRISIRSCNFTVKPDGKWHFADGGEYAITKILYGYLNADTLKITKLKQLGFNVYTPIETKTTGLEDARIFWRDDGMHFSGVQIDTRPFYMRPAAQAEYVLDEKTGKLNYIRTLKSPSPARAEKNWMPTNQPADFDFNYSPTEVYKDGKVSVVTKQSYRGYIHGGSQLIWQPDSETYLAVLHSKHLNPMAGVVYDKYLYLHYFGEYSKDGVLIRVSEPFTFGTGENIEFASGLVELGDDMLISFGIRDARLGMARLTKSAVLATLNDYDGTEQPPVTVMDDKEAQVMLQLKRDYDRRQRDKARLRR